jgi:NADH:ubiquinone oxidoreductase subunit E
MSQEPDNGAAIIIIIDDTIASLSIIREAVLTGSRSAALVEILDQLQEAQGFVNEAKELAT